MKSALIFAAGRGERLYPITRRIPKALCQIHGITLIEYHIVNLKKAGIEHLFINHAYLGDQIKRHLGNGSKYHVEISYIPEPPGGLETGGTILSLLPQLKEDTFLTVNADIYTDYDFSKLPEPKAEKFAHIVLTPQSALQTSFDFGLFKDGIVTLEAPQYIFSGIASYHRTGFSKQTFRRFSLGTLLRTWAKNNLVSGELYTKTWFDIGTPERLKYLGARYTLYG